MRIDWMYATTVIGSAALALACVGIAGCDHGRSAPKARGAVERGKYLVTVGGCNECHTTKTFGPDGPQPDASKLLAGHPEAMKMPPPPPLPAHGAWGVVASPTLTAPTISPAFVTDCRSR